MDHGKELVEFYSLLYTTDHPIISDDLENLVEVSISEAENEQLINIHRGEEIWDTLKKMHPDKALGLTV